MENYRFTIKEKMILRESLQMRINLIETGNIHIAMVDYLNMDQQTRDELKLKPKDLAPEQKDLIKEVRTLINKIER